MSALANLSPHRRAVFVSDVHLGSRHCHATELARFLLQLRCERLYLVGDIIDLWWMAHRRANWRQSHSEVIQAPACIAPCGYRDHLHPRQPRCLAAPGLWADAAGDGAPPRHPRDRRWRRLLVVHGDEYDGVTHFGGLQEKFGDWLYYRIRPATRR